MREVALYFALFVQLTQTMWIWLRPDRPTGFNKIALGISSFVVWMMCVALIADTRFEYAWIGAVAGITAIRFLERYPIQPGILNWTLGGDIACALAVACILFTKDWAEGLVPLSGTVFLNKSGWDLTIAIACIVLGTVTFLLMVAEYVRDLRVHGQWSQSRMNLVNCIIPYCTYVGVIVFANEWHTWIFAAAMAGMMYRLYTHRKMPSLWRTGICAALLCAVCAALAGAIVSLT